MLRKLRNIAGVLVMILGNLLWLSLSAKIQVNIFGFLNDQDSLSRHTSSIIDCLLQEQDLQLNLLSTKPGAAQDLSPGCAAVYQRAAMLCNKKQIAMYAGKRNLLSGMVIYADPECRDLAQFAPLLSHNTIRIASVVTETTDVPSERVAEINAHCDALMVPDAWLVAIYKQAGITCPIFTLPLALDLTSLLARPIKKRRNSIFTFGFSGMFLRTGRKNHEGLMQAFAEEYGGNEALVLKLHGKSGGMFEAILASFNQLKTSNISLECRGFERQAYEDFLASLDCYVTVSKGEGFSIIPREVLALGISCILANNTAQTTICNSGCVRPIVSDILEPAPMRVGYWFNTDPREIRAALRDVYEHYDYYFEQAAKGREWVKQYQAKNLAAKYRSLVAPRFVVLGDHNEINDHFIMMDSEKLFEKYKRVCKSQPTRFYTVCR